MWGWGSGGIADFGLAIGNEPNKGFAIQTYPTPHKPALADRLFLEKRPECENIKNDEL